MTSAITHPSPHKAENIAHKACSWVGDFDPNPLRIADRKFSNRLMIGTGKLSSPETLSSVIENTGTQIVTVALRRIDTKLPLNQQDCLSGLDRSKILLLPNTSGARTAKDAVHLARLSRELGGGNWVKLEVTPEPRYLLPDPVETFKAAEILVKEEFIVLPYIHADPLLALRLQDIGCSTVMPLGSPIGTNQGVRTIDSIRIIIEQIKIPVVVDAGLGAPSHASLAMEMGADAVLINTAIAAAKDPSNIATSFALSVVAGRASYLDRVHNSSNTDRESGWKNASASSPLTGFLDERKDSKITDL